MNSTREKRKLKSISISDDFSFGMGNGSSSVTRAAGNENSQVTNLKGVEMKNFRNLLVFLAVLISGCAVGHFSETQSFGGTDSFAIVSPRGDILDVIADVGKEMGMSVSSLDKKRGTIGLSAQGSKMRLLMAAVSSSMLAIEVTDAGKTLQISSTVVGNFGTGSQDASMKLTEEFKNRLAKKLGQGKR